MKLYNASKVVLGIDEAGRGCIAGPIVVAGVILNYDMKYIENIRDSKKLSKKQRDLLYKEIISQCYYKVSIVNIEDIEMERNILTSTMKGMHDIIQNTHLKVDNIIIDGNHTPYSRGIAKLGDVNCVPIIKGDDIFIDIAAASIVAKVMRDRIMESLSKEYDDKYDWHKNMGYGTKRHYEALRIHGLSDQHRKYWFEDKQESFIY